MKLIVFSKMLKDKSIEELIDLASEFGIDGYDMAVRPGYLVNPDNVDRTLGPTAEKLRAAGIEIPLVTANTDLLDASQPEADRLLGAMADAGVPRVKLGYFKFDPNADYWLAVDDCRAALAAWSELAERHDVQVVYHTHSSRCMGLNAGLLAHLLRGLDATRVGAYLDTGHLVQEGEEFELALAITGHYLSAVSLKDFLLRREQVENHGRKMRTVVEAGQGMVDWTAVFTALTERGYDGPASIHCEFEVPEEDFLDAVRRESQFFIDLRARFAAH